MSNEQPEWMTAKWVYKPMNNGFEICWISAEGKLMYFLEGDGDLGITDEEDVAKHIVNLHNRSRDVQLLYMEELEII